MSVTTRPSAPGPGSRPQAGPTAVLGSYGRVAAWLSKRVEVALSTVDLTVPQFRVLGLLAEGSSAASGLADRLAVRRPSITALMDGLVARGLVVRRQEDSDRRRVELRLTKEGERTLAAADRAVDDYLVSIAGHLPAKEEAAAKPAAKSRAKARVETKDAPEPASVETEAAGAAAEAPAEPEAEVEVPKPARRTRAKAAAKTDDPAGDEPDEEKTTDGT